jgi:hypothetical protein
VNIARRSAFALSIATTLAFAGCGGDGEKKPDTNTTAPLAAPAEGNTFKAPGIGFTFTYPDGFEQVDEPNDGKVLSTVTPASGDVRNGLKVRRTSSEKLEFASYSGSIRDQFEDQLGVDVKARTVNEGAREFGILEWSNSVTYQDLGQETTTRVHSQSWFFTAGDQTWQLECLSDTEHRKVIEDACKQAIDSLEETR